ncbi:MAG: FAD-binding oxidoreductase [Deltaproteobacteria bacterium]|nr:MAG: FAD-binding oxidoreductase [Deltaproteobacteria bacterium]
MKLSSEALSVKLEHELDAGSLVSNPASLAAYAVEEKIAALVCFPSQPEQVASILRVCAEADAAVVPWGGGTSMRLGNIPSRVDVAVGLERLDKLIEHDDANLTATVQAGMTIASFQQLLGRRRQFLPVDPPHPERATIGGIVAANVNGPRRMAYGGVRDLVIGMKMVLATGEQVKAGGKVVKNVAGYDLCKLFVGSLGTLGIITEVTFRMAPRPESAASFLASGSLAQCIRFVGQIFSSPLLPAAVTLIGPDAAKPLGHNLATPAVVVWIEGFEEAITRHLRDLQSMAGGVGLTGEVLRNEPHNNLWEEMRNFGTNGDGVLYRITISASAMAELLTTVERSSSDKDARYIVHPATGTLWLLLDGDPASMEWFPRLAALAQNHKGHAVIAAAPHRLKEGIDVWGGAPPSLSLMREIKHQFDPQGILNPGRFLAYL